MVINNAGNAIGAAGTVGNPYANAVPLDCVSINKLPRHFKCYGRKLLHEVKDYFVKHPHQFVTPKEFAEYSGIKLEVVHE